MRLLATLLMFLACMRVDAAVTVNDLTALTYPDGLGNTLPYRLFTPSGRGAGQTFPLVLFLHGAGGRGTDNLWQINDQPIALALCDPDRQADWPCFVIAPQCPAGQTWAAINAGDNWNPSGGMPLSPTWPLAAAKAVVDQLLAANADIDPAQVYVAGWSMGGYGSWESAVRWPSTFRKLVPICGGGDNADLNKATILAPKPIWAFHAADDGTVPVARSQTMVAAVRSAGGNPLYTEYPGAMGIGHAAWTPAFSDSELFPWLFGRARSPTYGGDGLAAAYRNNTTFTGSAVASGFISRPDVNYGSGSPAAGITVDNFCARFTGMLLPPTTGTYTFTGSADDSAALWVNGTQIFALASSGIGSIALTAGAKVAIQIDVVEMTGTASALVQWQPPGASAVTGIPRDVLFSGASGVARPIPPSDLAASVAGTDVALAWSDNSSNEAGFLVDYSSDGLTWTTAITVAANATAYTVNGLAATTHYRFRVRGINASGLSTYGPIVQVLTGAVGGGGVAGSPAFTPGAGSYGSAQTVTIISATSGATIHYTTNGSTPTSGSPVYSAPIIVGSASATLKAIARKTGLADSAIASASYVIAGGSSPPTTTVAAGGSCGIGSGVSALALMLLGVVGVALAGKMRRVVPR